LVGVHFVAAIEPEFSRLVATMPAGRPVLALVVMIEVSFVVAWELVLLLLAEWGHSKGVHVWSWTGSSEVSKAESIVDGHQLASMMIAASLVVIALVLCRALNLCSRLFLIAARWSKDTRTAQSL